ncbi:hypothetical protein AAVH_05406 [Aphelenchoides avenae]|nr:hypothetical protein AAVH_05406 [Aphelenchus avenae]
MVPFAQMLFLLVTHGGPLFVTLTIAVAMFPSAVLCTKKKTEKKAPSKADKTKVADLRSTPCGPKAAIQSEYVGDKKEAPEHGDKDPQSTPADPSKTPQYLKSTHQDEKNAELPANSTATGGLQPCSAFTV